MGNNILNSCVYETAKTKLQESKVNKDFIEERIVV